jgi:hypothetical protein
MNLFSVSSSDYCYNDYLQIQYNELLLFTDLFVINFLLLFPSFLCDLHLILQKSTALLSIIISFKMVHFVHVELLILKQYFNFTLLAPQRCKFYFAVHMLTKQI